MRLFLVALFAINHYTEKGKLALWRGEVGLSQLDKLKKRLVRLPNDFSWGELQKLLGAIGYRENQSGKTSGSRVKFVHGEHPPIMFHKPHPKPTLKAYQIKQLMAVLKERGQL